MGWKTKVEKKLNNIIVLKIVRITIDYKYYL